MIKYLIVLCLIATSAFAQDAVNAQQKIEATIGKLIVENILLTTKIDSLNKELSDLKKKSEEKK